MSEDVFKGYRIVNRHGTYSKGIIHSGRSSNGNTHFVQWADLKGKVWTSEKNVKEHLLKCTQKGISMDGWRIVEVFERETKPIHDWVDGKMLVKIIKTAGKGV